MRQSAAGAFGAQLKALREAAGFTQEELATIAGLSVHAVSALERGERRRPHAETVRALSAALDLTGAARDAFVASSRASSGANALRSIHAATLPFPPTALLGRDVEMLKLRTWFADANARLITLVGPGGVGKTRLALELAHAIAEQPSTHVLFVSLASSRDADLVAPAIAEALGLPDATALDLPTRARLALRDASYLLVLDNFEHVLDAAPLIAALLTSVASLRVLATSRAPLRLRGEREYVVEPLSLVAESAAVSPADLARTPAVRFFLDRIRQVRPDFRLTPANAPAVLAICRRLDALPLALELAAPWLKALTPEALLRRLTQDALPAVDGARDLPARQQTMTATVAWSYHLLDEQERQAFRRLGALPGRFSIEAARAVLTDGDGRAEARALQTVSALIDKSLLRRTGAFRAARPRYEMLETVRTYAAVELSASNEREAALNGLARYCGDEAALAADGLVGTAQVEWLKRVHDDLDNHRAALTWHIERRRPIEAAGIACPLTLFWLIRGLTSEGLRWYEQILRLPSLPPAVESRVLAGLAEMLCAQGELTRARRVLPRALALANAAPDAELPALTATMFGRVELSLGHLAAARGWWSDATSRFQALALPWGVGNGLFGLASVALASGDDAQAEQLLDRAATALRDAGSWFLTRIFYLRAVLAVRRGQVEDALAAVRESLTRIDDLQDRFALLYTLVPLAAAAALKGDDLWAARILGAWHAVSESGGRVVLKPIGDLRAQTEQDVRGRLSADRWRPACAAGRRSSIEGMLAEIDATTQIIEKGSLLP